MAVRRRNIFICWLHKSDDSTGTLQAAIRFSAVRLTQGSPSILRFGRSARASQIWEPGSTPFATEADLYFWFADSMAVARAIVAAAADGIISYPVTWEQVVLNNDADVMANVVVLPGQDFDPRRPNLRTGVVGDEPSRLYPNLLLDVGGSVSFYRLREYVERQAIPVAKLALRSEPTEIPDLILPPATASDSILLMASMLTAAPSVQITEGGYFSAVLEEET